MFAVHEQVALISSSWGKTRLQLYVHEQFAMLMHLLCSTIYVYIYIYMYIYIHIYIYYLYYIYITYQILESWCERQPQFLTLITQKTSKNKHDWTLIKYLNVLHHN